ncbi:hypothetical protein GCM10010399_56060 [Dactylosporangium fulvum]
MFDGFQLDRVDLWDVTLPVRHGGRGPAVLLLHGRSSTHRIWQRVAPLLADGCTVVCPELPAGPSGRHETALNCMALMKSFGHDQFSIAGRDDGAHIALHLALAHPILVERLALLDTVAPEDEPARRRRLTCPTLVLWSADGLGHDPSASWQPWLEDVRWAETRGDQDTAAALRAFLGQAPGDTRPVS